LTKIIQHNVNHPAHLSGAGNIGPHRNGAAALFPQHAHQSLRFLFRAVVIHRDGIACSGKAPGGFRADSPGRAGNQNASHNPTSVMRF